MTDWKAEYTARMSAEIESFQKLRERYAKLLGVEAFPPSPENSLDEMFAQIETRLSEVERYREALEIICQPETRLWQAQRAAEIALETKDHLTGSGEH